ncbi:DNA-binding protein [Methylobacterium sp. J-078]|uniref:DNA-binding protein n=1 Tax=Methylobacterium sp. J-078 TaxID=2836657 RepID=UPI001FB88B83|nr:DNA-binding protein [Methylobacterium sp. J-078]MCJ2047994.1 DNA-binding protein [Methylobacterium sp. J-078]
MRKQTRRSFTVEIKHSITSGRSFIPTKQPRVPRKGKSTDKALADPSPAETGRDAAPAPGLAECAEPRRILPSLIVWEPPQPDPEPEVAHEAPLPRVRRVVPSLGADGMPRRRGRPRKVVPEGEPVVVAPPVPAPPRIEALVPARAVPVALVRPQRVARPEVAALPRAERWKRRLPRACW